MGITQKEYDLEILSLKNLGLTDDDIEGYIDFYKDIFEIKKRRVINSGSKKIKKCLNKNY